MFDSGGDLDLSIYSNIKGDAYTIEGEKVIDASTVITQTTINYTRPVPGIEESVFKKVQIHLEEIENTVENIIKSIDTAETDTFHDLLSIKTIDECTYIHSVNAAMLSYKHNY